MKHLLSFLLMLGCWSLSAAGISGEWTYPEVRALDDGVLTIHSPQVISWQDYKQAELFVALEYVPAEGEELLATARLSGSTVVDMDARLVMLSGLTVEELTIADQEGDAYVNRLQQSIREETHQLPLDIFLASLAHDVLEVNEVEGLSTEPPTIYLKTKPTLLLFVNGDPVEQALEDTGLKIIANANWPVVKAETGEYFLLNKAAWFESAKLEGPWKFAANAPEGIEKLGSRGQHVAMRVIEQSMVADGADILTVTKPSELIVVDGEIKLEEIPATEGLQFVSNTNSPLFRLEDTWYYLAAGRWFETADPISGDWRFQPELPDNFASIPTDHGMSYVLASVAGTLQARMAILEATMPVEKTLPNKSQLKAEVTFDGEPQFETIGTTGIERAINTPFDVLRYHQNYYLCFEGAWYQTDDAEGEWVLAFRVPDAIYNIPPESPAYSTTQVRVASITPSSVTYSSTSAYETSIYISHGVPVYGTGWYFAPYLYWYPQFSSYGYGSFYNPATGSYATRSVWYGPYGGYSYNEAYNPTTGRRGWVETAWDSDEWASYGETYNPRTGTYTETERYFNDDTDRFAMERDIDRGGDSVHVEREFDVDDGWSTTDRGTSNGGSSYVERDRQEDGSWEASGSFETGDGRSGTIDGEISDGQRRTEIKGSEGGQLVSGGDGENRGFIGKDSDGDLYAGKNGQIYKKDGEQWQQYNPENRSWQSSHAESRDLARQSDYARTTNRDYRAQLSRDARARSMGQRQFQRRSGGGRFRGRR